MFPRYLVVYLAVSYMCLFWVSNWTKEVLDTVKCAEEGKGKEEATQTVLRECRKYM